MQLSDSNPVCYYTVSWTAPFDGALYIVYSLNSGRVDQQVLAVSLLFSSQQAASSPSSSSSSSSSGTALPLSSSGSPPPPPVPLPSPSGSYFLTPTFFPQPPQCVALFVLTDGSSLYCTTTATQPEQPFALRMSSAGELQQVFVGPTAASEGGQLRTTALTVDASGSLYSSYWNGSDYLLLKFSSDGQLQPAFQTPFPGGTPQSVEALLVLDYPVGLQTDADGILYLLASTHVLGEEGSGAVYLFQLDSSSGAVVQQSAAIANDPDDYWFNSGLSLSAQDGSLVLMAGGYGDPYALLYYATQPLQLLRSVPLPDFPYDGIYEQKGELLGLGTDSRGDAYLTYTFYSSATGDNIVVLRFDGGSGALLEVRETAVAYVDLGVYYGYYYGSAQANASFLSDGYLFAVDGAGNVYLAALNNATTAQTGLQDWGVYVATASTSPTAPVLPPPPAAAVYGAAVLTEYNSGWQALLYSGVNGSAVDPLLYSTSTDSPGSLFFSLDWAGDAVNQVTLVSSSYDPLVVAALPSSSAACALLPGQPIALSAALPSCGYSVSWPIAFSDQLVFFYSTGPGVLPARALTVGLRFSMAGQQPGFAQPVGSVFNDSFSGFSASFPSPSLLSLSSVSGSGAVVYTGGGPGWDSFTVSCNGADCLSLSNQVWLLLPPSASLLTLLPSLTDSQSLCSIPPQSAVLLGSFDYPGSCEYNLSWTGPVDALLPIVYLVSDYSGTDSPQALVIVLQISSAQQPPALPPSSSSSLPAAASSSSSVASGPSSAQWSSPLPSAPSSSSFSPFSSTALPSSSSSLPLPSSLTSALESSSSSPSPSPLSSSSSSSLLESGLPVTAPPGSSPVYGFQLQSLSAAALVVTEPQTVTPAGQFLNNLVVLLVAQLNASAEAEAGLPSFSTLPALDLSAWSDSVSAFAAWGEQNEYALVHADASGLSVTQSSSVLTLQLPGLASTGYHRMILVSPSTTSNLTDWLFVVPFVCTTLLLADGQCVPCPAGAFCVGDGRAWPLPAWWSVNEHSAPDACPLSTSCAGALDVGPNADSPDPVLNPDGSRNTQRCYADYDSELCSGCDVDYYHDGLACRYCGSDNGGQLAGLLIAALVIFSVLTLILTLAAPLSLNSQVGYVLTLQQVVAIGQTAAQYLPSSWAWLAAVFRDVSLLNLDVRMFQPGCLIAQLSFVSVFWLTLLLVAVLGLLFTLAAAARAALVQHYANAGGRPSLYFWAQPVPPAGSALDGSPKPGSAGFLLRMQYLTSLPAWIRDEACVAFRLGHSSRAAFRPLFCVRWRQSMLVLGAVAYLRLTTVCLQMLDCVTVQQPVMSGDPAAGSTSQRVLTADYSTRCFQGEHVPAFIVALVLLCGFSLGFVLLVAAGLLRIHSDGYIEQRMERLRAWSATASAMQAAAEAEPSTASSSSAVSMQELLTPSLPGSHTVSLSRGSSAPPSPPTPAVRPSPGRQPEAALPVSAGGQTTPPPTRLRLEDLSLALRLLERRLKRGELSPSKAALLSTQYLHAAQSLVLSERAAQYGYFVALYKPRAFLYPVPLLLLSVLVAAAVVFPSSIAVTLLLCGLGFIVQGAVTALFLPFVSARSNGKSLVSAAGRLAQCLAALGILHAVNPSSYSPSPSTAAHSASAQAELETLTERFFAENVSFIVVLLACMSVPVSLLLLGGLHRRWRAEQHQRALDPIVTVTPAASTTAGTALPEVEMAETATGGVSQQPTQAAQLRPLTLSVATAAAGRWQQHEGSAPHDSLQLDIAAAHAAPLQLLRPPGDWDDVKEGRRAEVEEQRPLSILIGRPVPPPLPVRPHRPR